MAETGELDDDLKELKRKLDGIHLTLKFGFICLIVLLSMVLWKLLLTPS